MNQSTKTNKKKRNNYSSNEEINHKEVKLNEIDRDILRYIQKDGRASFRTISKQLNMSVSTVSKHIEDLKNLGVIKHFAAIINCCSIGYHEMILLFLKINSQAGIQETSFELKKIKKINAIFQVSGIYPIFCIAKCISKEEQIMLIEKINNIPGIEEITTHVVLQKIKEDMRVSIPDKN